MSADVEVREALDRLAQAAKDFNTDEGLDAVDEDYRLVGGALADAERTAGEQIQANFALTAQLQAAQATIAEMTEATDASHGSKSERLLSVAMIGSRADTSAHGAAIVAAKNEGWDEACKALAWCFDNGPERDALPYLIEHNPFRAASIEQTEADRG